MNTKDIDVLFNSNMEELNKMNIASGSMIKALLQGIEQNGPAYIRLSNAVELGHSVNYRLVEGSQAVVNEVAALFGLKISNSLIEANHA